MSAPYMPVFHAYQGRAFYLQIDRAHPLFQPVAIPAAPPKIGQQEVLVHAIGLSVYEKLVAEQDAQVGTISIAIKFNLKWGLHLHLVNLLIWEPYHRIGIGTALLECVDRLAKLHGINLIWGYSEGTLQADQFYLKYGYAIDGTEIIRVVGA